jgi:thiamine kinase-like enzyme
VSLDARLDACLPADLRPPATTITKMAAGLSGAGVYRVDAAGRSYVLKIATAEEPLAEWRRTLHIRRAAAEAGVAPAVVHVDEERRAVVSAFVVDRSFPTFFHDPRTHDAALDLLGRTLRRVHDIPLPADALARDPRDLLAATWTALRAAVAVPPFVEDAVRRVQTETPPPADRAPALSHNDLNPSNLVYDGERIVLFDWEAAGANDPLYDLAVVALFFRMDEATRARLLTAHDGAPAASLPERFGYLRRLAGVLCGVMFLHLARQRGHGGAAGDETLDAVPGLGEFYQRLRAGGVSLAAAEGQWLFGLTLVKEAIA